MVQKEYSGQLFVFFIQNWNCFRNLLVLFLFGISYLSFRSCFVLNYKVIFDPVLFCTSNSVFFFSPKFTISPQKRTLGYRINLEFVYANFLR